jgi:penicillin-binding protein 2
MIARDGHSVKPHFLKGYIDKSDNFVEIEYPKLDAKVSKTTMDIVKSGMFGVINRSGTATNIKSPELAIAGKTGTAQNPHGEDHALFVAFAPFDDPKIAVSVIVENVGFGSTHAAPIAKEVIKIYLNKLNEKNNKLAGLEP